jgi:nanoRNase/pAp phosphatase (c-di-AMP/oligoRNAs hydrolase)
MQIATTHRNADFDALASVIAAKVIYPSATVVLPRALNPNVKAFLSIHKDLFETVTASELDLTRVDRLVVVDTACWSRLDGLEPLRSREELEVVVWDHHPGERTILASGGCSRLVGATTTLLVGELRRRRKILTPMQATLFLAGIYEDTGNLTFPSTTAEDAAAVAWLLRRKADLNILSSFLRPTYNEKHSAILFQMLQQARTLQIKGHRIGIMTVEVDGHTDSLAVVLCMCMDFLNVDAGFAIISQPEKSRCMVIGRSQSHAIDVAAVLRRFGGGGHPRAASAQVKSEGPEEVERRIVEAISIEQQAAARVSDLMSFPVHTVTPTATMEDVAMILRTRGITGVPVVDGNRVVGIVSRRDFRKVRNESKLKSPVKAYMSREVLTIDPGRSPAEAARLMVQHDIGRLPVVADGRVIGIVSRSDVMRYFYDLLPD